MQAAHPVAFAGFFSHTASLDNPHPRLARTALAVNTVIFGSVDQAREVQQIVGTMHGRVRGKTKESAGPFPAGTEYRGDSPALLRWILAAFVDSSYLAYERYVRPLSPDEREELWQQWVRVAEIFGLRADQWPSSYDVHRRYVAAMLESGQLIVTPAARELSREIILNPPLPPAMLPIKLLINQLTIDSLPAELRKQYAFQPVPGRGLVLGATAQWWRRLARPIAPSVVREVPPFVMPAPGRGYGEIAQLVNEQFG